MSTETDTDVAYTVINQSSGKHLFYTNDKIADFLYEHLDEFGDKREYIMRCLDYVFNAENKRNGFILLGIVNDDIVGAVVINETGMGGYIPENILVYIAVHKEYRGKGLGKKLMEGALKVANGDVALHVEPNNPAVHLYKKVGFTNKYLEMRYTREK